MKRIDLIVLALLFIMACTPKQQEEGTTETAKEETETPAEETVKLTGNFGDVISEEGAIAASELVTKLESEDSISAKVESEILATCAMKGCWMNVSLNNDEHMRVTFKDYGFFVPKEGVEGKKVVFEGYAKKVTTDVEILQHFAKDAGKSQEEIDAITEPKEEITFIASGVIIKE